MTIDNARRFVERMRQDQSFRERVLANAGPEELLSFLQKEDIQFDQRELVGAMAECMARLES